MTIICSKKETKSSNLAIRITDNKLEIVELNINIPFKNTLKWENIEKKNIIGIMLTMVFNKQESINNLIFELKRVNL